jgi:hypothetical protein
MNQFSHFEEHCGNNCANCWFRKEKHPRVPDECKECPSLPDRNKSYCTNIPVFKDDYVPNDYSEHIRVLQAVVRENVPVDSNGRITKMFFDWEIGTPQKDILDYYEEKLRNWNK